MRSRLLVALGPSSLAWLWLLLASGVCLAPAAYGQLYVPAGTTWLYLDDGSDQATAWRAPSFDDSGWASGPAELGYGDWDEATVVASGPDGAHYITTYFRHRFDLPGPPPASGLTLRVLRDDGAVVYLNGTEIFRTNMPAGAIDYLTWAPGHVAGADEDVFHEISVDPSLLVPSGNVLAVEIHQNHPNSPDISFDLELLVRPPPEAPALLRVPYLQRGTPISMVVRWRTDQASESRLSYGPAPDDLSTTLTLPGPITEHEVEIAGLDPDTTYYYSVGTSQFTLAGADFFHAFTTSPTPATRRPIRIWVIGDSGKASQRARDVRDAYLHFSGADIARAWLMLGDNAYVDGTDAEYTAAVFGNYPQVLRNTVLWPSPGNHDFHSADSATQSGPYYEAFTLPSLGEAGGVPSSTEAYYSFDYGNVHFVSLDSADTDPSVGGAMYQWLDADLATNDRDWLIAYWHHAPYSKGGHDSDVQGRMTAMRENFLPLLESYGVDLVLGGHSHNYERSMLIDGHYGSSETFNSAHVVGAGDGDPNGGGAYQKPAIGPDPNQGTVYAVVGSSSQSVTGTFDHPAMTVAIAFEGSLVVDVTGRQLDAWWIDRNGLVQDRFQILKGPPLPACNDGADNDGDGSIDYPTDPGCFHPASTIEDPQCQDGNDNDPGQDPEGLIDFDGGQSIHGDCTGGSCPPGVSDPDLNGVADADPQCVGKPWQDREWRSGPCGLGAELLLVMPLWWVVRRSVRRRKQLSLERMRNRSGSRS